ncbi:MAG: hypothetical protein Q9M97_00875 [Candidatus Gracilibacteria bacterium]|nr:hypothetical protein [Candidatus Gracilibacteria bacterium]
MDALDELNMTEIDRIRDDCLKSEHYRIKQFGRTIKRCMPELKDFVSIQLMNLNLLMLLTEGINNLCKVAKRVSHGFSFKSYVYQKINC